MKKQNRKNPQNKPKNYREQHYRGEVTKPINISVPISLKKRIKDLANTYTAQKTAFKTMSEVELRALDIGVAYLEKEQRDELLKANDR